MSDRTRIDRLIEDVLACAPEERDAFLDAACEGNEALRREIASLLEQASRAHSFLEEPAAAPSLVGRMLGPYRIDAPIGAGGMGEVYRARDTKLGRNVAIKILPAFMAQDPDRLARLGREARALAALNHPHIGSIYGLEEADGVRGLVLELVDGETLADRIAKGPMAITEALRIAGQIAEALAAAHAKGIVHRDLKPANIKISTTGSVKVLDFGLAKTEADESGATTLATREGAVMGTPAYMSPEQARGEPVDQQTDIWAFGCVLYEMLTARRAFDGGTASDSIAAVLTAEPDWRTLPSATPAAVRTLLARCLAKDRARRLHSIADARFDLDDALTRTAPVGETTRWPARQWWSLAAAVGLAIGVALYLFGQAGPVASPSATQNVELDLPDGFGPWAGVAISPDGSAIAASIAPGLSEGGRHLIVRYLDQVNGWRRINGGENGEYPFWSPDGRHLGFFVKGKLLRVDPPNGTPHVVCDVVDGRGGVWLEDGTIVFGDLTGPLMRVDAQGGRAPAVFVPIEEGQRSLRHPARAGPGRLLYLAVPDADNSPSELRSFNLDAPLRSTAIMKTARSGVYDRGQLFFERKGSIIRQGFDPSTSGLHGEPVRVPNDGVFSGRQGYLPMDVAGGHVVVATVSPPLSQLVWANRDGMKLAEIGGAFDQGPPDLSPDGKRIAIARRAPGQSVWNIWIVDASSTASRQLTADVDHYGPQWTPDGQRLVFNVGAPSSTLAAANLDGSSPVPLVERVANTSPLGWTSDDRLVWAAAGTTADTDPRGLGIFVNTGPSGSRETAVRLRTGFPVSNGRLSPDGRHVAYTSVKSGQQEVYVDTFPKPAGEPEQISRNGGRSPRWRRDSRELYFVGGNQLMAVAVSPGTTAPFAAPKRLFNLPARSHYSVNADGSKFVVLEQRTSPASPLKLTLNWFASLAARD